MDGVKLLVSVPLASFRVAQAREYWETYPIPPPSTLYGMLLSLVGEENRLVHQGAELAVALMSKPQRSVVLRTLWRVKNSKDGPGQKSNKRPDFQEIIGPVNLCMFIRKGQREQADPCLAKRVQAALAAPGSISRFGALSLGESTFLVDEVKLWPEAMMQEGRWLVADPEGDMSLPVWPDHVGAKTSWGQYRLEEKGAMTVPPQGAWTVVST
jgi:CRISPR-associated protein Cas5t